MEIYKKGELNVLIATDIAARGIDVEELSLVVNYDLPNIPETYVHRIGRTGRAKASGIALSFCNNEEKEYLKDIQKLINQQIPVIEDHPFPLDENDVVPPPQKQTKNQRKKIKRRTEGKARVEEKSSKPKKRRYYGKKRR